MNMDDSTESYLKQAGGQRITFKNPTAKLACLRYFKYIVGYNSFMDDEPLILLLYFY